MKEYKINELITLKLEGKSTVIYVKNSRFIQCKNLILSILIDDIPALEDIKSIDETTEKYEKTLNAKTRNIPPEAEFWGHCSNLQVWAENGYNTDLLSTDLSFPLLRELVKNGDYIAKEVMKEEILHRLKNGTDKAIIFLLDNDFLQYFTQEEISVIYDENLSKFQSSNFALPFLRAMVMQKIPSVKKDYKNLVRENLFKKINASDKELINFCHYLVALKKKDLINVFEQLRQLKDTTEEQKFRLLDILIRELQFDYGGVIRFNLSDIAKVLLVENEQNYFLEIANSSPYPYTQLDFASDEVRRRHWENKLYFETYRGHIYSIEIELSRFNEEKFYKNLKDLKNFSKIELVNLLCWKKYNSSLVKQTLLHTKSIKLIQIYEFFKLPPNLLEISPD